MLIALVFSAVLGFALDRMLFRYLRTAPPMTRLVTTLGLLVAIPEIVKLFFDVGTTFQPQGIVPEGSTVYNLFGQVFLSRDDLATVSRDDRDRVSGSSCSSGTRRSACACARSSRARA